MVTLKAHRPLLGDYGRVEEGQTFICDEATAEFLEARGLVSRPIAPKAYWRPPENKMIIPVEQPRIEATPVIPKGKRK